MTRPKKGFHQSGEPSLNSGRDKDVCRKNLLFYQLNGQSCAIASFAIDWSFYQIYSPFCKTKIMQQIWTQIINRMNFPITEGKIVTLRLLIFDQKEKPNLFLTICHCTKSSSWYSRLQSPPFRCSRCECYVCYAPTLVKLRHHARDGISAKTGYGHGHQSFLFGLSERALHWKRRRENWMNG